LSETEVNLPVEKIRQAALELQGDFDWPVPIFSAAKVNGKKLYEFGRKEEAVDLPIKRMTFSEVDVSDVTAKTVSARLRCSKGSFIRTWCAELGEKLGVGGHLEELVREEVGPYQLSQAVTLEQLEELVREKAPLHAFIPMSDTLPGWRAVRVTSKEERLLSNG